MGTGQICTYVQIRTVFPHWVILFAINDVQTLEQIKSYSPIGTPSIQYTALVSSENTKKQWYTSQFLQLLNILSEFQQKKER